MLSAAPTTRARDFTEALEQAKATGNDIAVLQRGSDWSRLGETIYQNIWSSPDLTKSLGDGFVLVAVDRPERSGLPAIGETAPGAPLPTNEISSIEAAGGAGFQKTHGWRLVAR